MSTVSENIRYLRKLHGFTQEAFANAIGIKRSLVGAYEEGRADPRLHNLVKIAALFEISTDMLLQQALTGLSKTEINNKKPKATAQPKLKILPITVDHTDRENIELVPQKAAAGYLNGYSDPEYIKELPRFQLPFLPKNATYRAFELSGDSMLPLSPGTIIIGKYIEQLADIVSGKTYVVVSVKEGIVYKRVFNYIEEKAKLFLVSDNNLYQPFELDVEDVMELWEAKAFISVDFPEKNGAQSTEMKIEDLAEMVYDLKNELIKLKNS